MFGRSRRLVPAHHLNLIKIQRLPKPNWFVGAAEQSVVPRDPALVADIDRLKTELRQRRRPSHAAAAPDQGAEPRPADLAPTPHRV